MMPFGSFVMDAATMATRDRRTQVRLARGTRVEIQIIDPLDSPERSRTTLCDAQVINVSAEGLAIMTSTRVRPGSTLCISLDDSDSLPGGMPCKFRVLNCLPHSVGKANTLHCVLSEGLMPAALIYNWAA